MNHNKTHHRMAADAATQAATIWQGPHNRDRGCLGAVSTGVWEDKPTHIYMAEHQ